MENRWDIKTRASADVAFFHFTTNEAGSTQDVFNSSNKNLLLWFKNTKHSRSCTCKQSKNYHVSYCSKYNDGFPSNRSPAARIVFASIGFMRVRFLQLPAPGQLPAVWDGALQEGSVPAVLSALTHCQPQRVGRRRGGLTTCRDAILHWLQTDTDSDFSPQLLFDMDKEIFPMVVQAVVDEGEGEWLSLIHWFHTLLFSDNFKL